MGFVVLIGIKLPIFRGYTFMCSDSDALRKQGTTFYYKFDWQSFSLCVKSFVAAHLLVLSYSDHGTDFFPQCGQH
jgi:hypothetical protein